MRRGSPLPIPNREVKPACADGTAICGRVCRRLSFENPSSIDEGFFVLYPFPTVETVAINALFIYLDRVFGFIFCGFPTVETVGYISLLFF